jgi:hypothetical protein
MAVSTQRVLQRKECCNEKAVQGKGETQALPVRTGRWMGCLLARAACWHGLPDQKACQSADGVIVGSVIAGSVIAGSVIADRLMADSVMADSVS